MRPRRGYESQPGLPPRHLSPQARAAGDCTPLYDHMCNKTLTSVVHRYPPASRRLEVACRPTEGREQYCTRSGRGGRAVGSHLNHRGGFTTDIATRTLEDGHRRRRWTSRRLDHQPQTSLRLRAGAVVWGRQSFTRLGFLHFATRRETHLSISWRIWSIVNLGILLPCSSCDTPDREEKEPRANLVPKKEDVVSARVHIKGAAEGTGRERALAATPDREFVCPSVFGSRSVGGEFPSLSFSMRSRVLTEVDLWGAILCDVCDVCDDDDGAELPPFALGQGAAAGRAPPRWPRERSPCLPRYPCCRLGRREDEGVGFRARFNPLRVPPLPPKVSRQNNRDQVRRSW